MFANPQPPRIHLPKGWQDCVKSAVLHAIALAHYTIAYARAWAADSINARVRLAAENDRLHEECALLREELLCLANYEFVPRSLQFSNLVIPETRFNIFLHEDSGPTRHTMF